MWANSVWGLFSLSVSCVLTMLGLNPDSPFQPLLLVGAIMFLLGGIGVLSWPLREAQNRVKITALAVHPTRVLRLIEPFHIIVLGLVIATAGTIWQWRRAVPANNIVSLVSAPAILPSTVAANSEIVWNYDTDKFPSMSFIGWSSGPNGHDLAYGFQARATNKTGSPIRNLRGFVRIDAVSAAGGKQIPITVQTIMGRPLPYGVEAGDSFIISAQMAEGGMPFSAFVKEFAPFTFVFEYDGAKPYERKFSKEEIKTFLAGAMFYEAKVP